MLTAGALARAGRVTMTMPGPKTAAGTDMALFSCFCAGCAQRFGEKAAERGGLDWQDDLDWHPQHAVAVEVAGNLPHRALEAALVDEAAERVAPERVVRGGHQGGVERVGDLVDQARADD